MKKFPKILSVKGRRNLFWGIFFTMPWIIGFIWFYVYPVGASLFYSFTKYDIIHPPQFIGLYNFKYMFSDRHYWRAVYNTLWFVICAVPINIAFSFIVALILNEKVIGRSVLRTLAYLPTIVPMMASATLWLWIFNPFGLINGFLAYAGIEAVPWLSHPDWTKPALTIVTLWICGNNIVIFLATLQDVPKHLKEAARIDGGNWWDELIYITIPFCTPGILFTTITGMIWAFQYFTFAMVLLGRGGGPAESALFYGMHIYTNAFGGARMGLASAMAWVLFLIVAAFTFILFKSSSRWVFYSGENV